MYVIIEHMIDIKELRQQLGLTQKELAQQLDVATLTVRRWEKGYTGMHLGNRKRLEQLALHTRENR